MRSDRLMFVFPAFNNNYKTRKRTFRCCKKCRDKRIRCMILDSDYELHGCDNCRESGFLCDLTMPLKQKPLNRSSRDTSDAPRSKIPDMASSALPDLFAAQNSQKTAPLPAQPEVVVKSEEMLTFSEPAPPKMSHAPQTNSHELPLGSILSSSQQFAKSNSETLLGGPRFDQANIPVIPSQIAQSGPVSTDGAITSIPTDNTSGPQDPPHHTKGKNVLFEGVPHAISRERSGSESWHLAPPFFPTVPLAPYVSTIESIDSIIDKIDWRYLKRHFDFNTNIRQSRFYFARTVTRRESNSPLQPETVKEVLAKKHFIRNKKLTTHNALHFKFLLSMHAFTLNTPGFYEISEIDLLKLFEIYFYKVNSVFPIVFEAEFWELYKRNKIPSTIIYAIVLIIARDKLAEPILARSFVNNGASFRENQVRLLTELELKIRQLLIFLPELGDTEKLSRLITQLLLLLNFKFNKFGNEQSSHDLVECVSYAYSLLIHQEFFHKRIAKEGAQKKSVYLKHLWWIIFTFDRFNGLLNGKAMFINRLDFNIGRPTDLPHLDELVSLAYALEDTLVAVFRPPRGSNKNGMSGKDAVDGSPEFHPAEYIEREMQAIRDIPKLKSAFMEYRQYETPQKNHLPGIPVDKYRDRIVLFLSRILSNQIVLILRTGQVKYSNDTPDIDEFSLVLSEAFLQLLGMLKDDRGSELVMEIPLIPLIMLVAFSVPLTSRLRVLTKLKNIGSSTFDYQKLMKVVELSKVYLTELEKIGEKWWFVNEVVASIKNLNQKMEDLKDKPNQTKKRPNTTTDDPVVKRERLSINALVSDPSDVESVLPLLLSITSPGFYDEVIDKDGSDEEDDVDEEEEESSDEFVARNDPHEAELVSDKVLIPPVLRNFSIPTFITAEDVVSRAQEYRNMATSVEYNEQGQPMPYFSSRDSVSSNDDVNFDVGQFAEVVNNETSFVPSIIDFLNEHEVFI